jgi:lipopolysaccharide transport system permease protein
VTEPGRGAVAVPELDGGLPNGHQGDVPATAGAETLFPPVEASGQEAPVEGESAAVPITRIRPSRGWVRLNLGELWEHRELLYFLVWRDLKVRYKRTTIGVAWAVLQPFLAMVVFSIFFGRFAGIPSDGVPYPIFAYAALVPWMYFANALTGATSAVVEHQAMISKVYFPRLFLPAAPVVGGLVDLAIALLVLLGMMLVFGIIPSFQIITVPAFLLLMVAAAFAVGLWLSALNALFRDVRYAVPFLVQFWLFASPVAYPSSIVPEPWRLVYGLNPMAGVIEGLRWALLGTGEAPGPIVVVSMAAVLLLLVSGLMFYRRVERVFADVV